MTIKKSLEKSRNVVKAKAKKRARLGMIRQVRSVQAHVHRARAALVSPGTSTQPPAAAGAHDDGEVKCIKYFGMAVTPGDARDIADIESWDDETIRGNQGCRSAHDQDLISLECARRRRTTRTGRLRRRRR